MHTMPENVELQASTKPITQSNRLKHHNLARQKKGGRSSAQTEVPMSEMQITCDQKVENPDAATNHGTDGVTLQQSANFLN